MAECYVIKQGGGVANPKHKGAPAIWPLDANCWPYGDVIIDEGIVQTREFIFNNLKSGPLITSLNIPYSLSSIGTNTFYNSNINCDINAKYVNYFGINCFQNTNITGLCFDPNYPKTEMFFAYNSFKNCTKMKGEYIDLPSNVKTLTFGDNSFNNCPIKGFNITSPISSLLFYQNCFSSSKVTDDFVNSIMNNYTYNVQQNTTYSFGNWFENCKQLKDVYVNHYGAGVFWGSSIETVLFSKNMHSVSTNDYDSSLYNIFAYCSNLRTVDFESDTVSSGISAINSTFCGATSLEYINNIPKSINRLRDSTFYDCHNLTQLFIPNNQITYIGNNCFYNCRNLSSLIFNGFSSVTLNNNAFRECYLQDESMDDFWNKIEEGGYGSLWEYIFNSARGFSVVRPSRVWSGMFYNCKDLKYVYSREGAVAYIGNMVFAECTNLKLIDLTYSKYNMLTGSTDVPRGSLFNNCKKLEKVYFNGNAISDTGYGQAIGNNMFYGCESLEYIDFSRWVTKNTASQVYANAFNGCVNLKQVAFHNGVSTVNATAFTRCYSLENVFFNSTKAMSGTWGCPVSFNIYNRTNCSTITYNMELKQNNITVSINNEQRDLNELPYIITSYPQTIECKAYSPELLPATTTISIDKAGVHEFANFDFSGATTDGYRITFEIPDKNYPDKIYIGYDNIEFEDVYTMIAPKNQTVHYRLVKANYEDLIGDIVLDENNKIVPLTMSLAAIYEYDFGHNSDISIAEQMNTFNNDDLFLDFRENNWIIEENPSQGYPGEISCDSTLGLNGITYATLKIELPHAFGEKNWHTHVEMLLQHYGTTYDYSFVYVSNKRFGFPTFAQVSSGTGTILLPGDYYLWRTNSTQAMQSIDRELGEDGEILYLTFGYLRGARDNTSYKTHKMGIRKLKFHTFKD